MGEMKWKCRNGTLEGGASLLLVGKPWNKNLRQRLRGKRSLSFSHLNMLEKSLKNKNETRVSLLVLLCTINLLVDVSKSTLIY